MVRVTLSSGGRSMWMLVGIRIDHDAEKRVAVVLVVVIFFSLFSFYLVWEHSL